MAKGSKSKGGRKTMFPKTKPGGKSKGTSGRSGHSY